ncbi:hypothetical protein NAMH_0165 [Nautilia profundicola AmH]|uniref:Cyclic nucleotide-binding domain-containing protein n=1 Tax=Nautilia profundicola (strain ATCC BAA-1463 / DSM 18972 / AmH) TaxID=598659 RepID=B9L7I7_NAUPA|nr:hypothetical protein [Nautilia profundicola]ACM93690.1 hypothetical protein NAMH_0165 [Nautilia profundicola AmH]
MNLFTEYTQEETEYLLSLTNNKYIDIKKEVKFLEDIDDYIIDKDIKKIEIKQLNKKSVIDKYEMIYIVEGEVVALKENKILKKIKKDEIFGITNLINNENIYLVTVQDSKICFMEFKSKKNIFFKLMQQIMKKCCLEKIM